MKRALVLMALSGCWFAPDRPGATGDAGTEAGIDPDGGVELRCIEPGDVLGPAVAVAADGGSERLLRLGLLQGRTVLLTYAVDATDTKCPIAISTFATNSFEVTWLAALSAATIDGNQYVFALVSGADHMSVHELREEPDGKYHSLGHVEVAAVPTSIPVEDLAESPGDRPAFVAYVDGEVWFGGGDTIVVVPIVSVLGGTASVAMTSNINDNWYLAVPRRSLSGLSTALVGASSNWSADYSGEPQNKVVTGTVAGGQSHGDCDGVSGLCVARIAKGLVGRTLQSGLVAASTHASPDDVVLNLSMVKVLGAMTTTQEVAIPDGPAGFTARDFDMIDLEFDANAGEEPYRIMAKLWRSDTVTATNFIDLLKIASTGGTPILGSPTVAAPEANLVTMLRTPTGPRLLALTTNPVSNPERCYDWFHPSLKFQPCP